MTDEELFSQIRELSSAEPCPERHRSQTDNCPPVHSFQASERTAWTPAMRRHASTCDYCQMMIGFDLDFECPPREAVVQFARRPELFLDSLAMTHHVVDGV